MIMILPSWQRALLAIETGTFDLFGQIFAKLLRVLACVLLLYGADAEVMSRKISLLSFGKIVGD